MSDYFNYDDAYQRVIKRQRAVRLFKYNVFLYLLFLPLWIIGMIGAWTAFTVPFLWGMVLAFFGVEVWQSSRDQTRYRTYKAQAHMATLYGDNWRQRTKKARYIQIYHAIEQSERKKAHFGLHALTFVGMNIIMWVSHFQIIALHGFQGSEPVLFITLIWALILAVHGYKAFRSFNSTLHHDRTMQSAVEYELELLNPGKSKLTDALIDPVLDDAFFDDDQDGEIVYPRRQQY